MKKSFSKFLLILLILCFILPMFVSSTSFTKEVSLIQEVPLQKEVPPSKEISPSAEKVVYLTFDDGPTPKITDAILDVLKAQDVKATFFIVGKEITGREAILKRIHEEGHTIGLHTFSHDFKKIYQSPDAFISEMEQTSAKINEVLQTQNNYTIIRFPGGSAGRLNKNFYDKLCNKGYLIFDWNVDLKDGIHGELSPSQFLQNSKKCMDRGQRRIILGHCNSNNMNTCHALADIINYYKGEGYTFKPITSDTAPYFYRFK